MTLLELKIAMSISHRGRLDKYYVVEALNDHDETCFIVINNNNYVFTLVPKKENVSRFELSKFDINRNEHDLDRELLAKIEASLYSIFLEEMPS
jgi:hypothetical protein